MSITNTKIDIEIAPSVGTDLPKVCVVGLGYVGLPTATVMARSGISVLGVDIDSTVVETIAGGKIHIEEPFLEGVVKNVVHKQLLRTSTQPEKSDVFMITVPTPITADKQPDITYVKAAITSIIDHLEPDNMVIIESTCPVFTTEKMADYIFSKRPDLNQDTLHIVYSPERILPGNVLQELSNNHRVIGGLTPRASETACALYRYFVNGQLIVVSAKEAELCKLVENSYRDVNIAFANEVSIVAEQAGIDPLSVINAANYHPRVSILNPGIGVGGHCIAVDPWFIASSFPCEHSVIRQARLLNDNKPKWVVDQILAQVSVFKQHHNREPVIALLGLAYKPDIDDCRESPAVNIVQQCMDESLKVLVSEPHISEYDGIPLVSYQEAAEAADMVVFLVAHRLFRPLLALPNKVVLDFSGLGKQSNKISS